MPDVLDEVKTGAEVTPSEPSTEPETSPATETEPTGEGQEKETKSEVVSTDAKDDDGKAEKDGRIPYPRFQKIYNENKEAKGILAKFTELGIESPEDAEFITRRAKEFSDVETLLQTDPLTFERNLSRVCPEAQVAIAQNTVSRFLTRRAAAYRAEGNEDMAKALDAERQALIGEEPPPRAKAQDRDEVLSEKVELFEEKVKDDISSRLTGKINDFVSSKGVTFKSEAQKNKFFQRVREGVADVLDGNDNFVKQDEQLRSPGLGLTKSQRKQVADFYEKYATANGRLDKAILEELSIMGIAPESKHVPPERKEVVGSGVAPEGRITQSMKDKVKTDLQKQGLTGADFTARYLGEMRKLRTGK